MVIWKEIEANRTRHWIKKWSNVLLWIINTNIWQINSDNQKSSDHHQSNIDRSIMYFSSYGEKKFKSEKTNPKMTGKSIYKTRFGNSVQFQSSNLVLNWLPHKHTDCWSLEVSHFHYGKKLIIPDWMRINLNWRKNQFQHQ